MDRTVLPGGQETLETEQDAQGEEGFRGGGAGDECTVSGYPLGILMGLPRDSGEKEDEAKPDKVVQAHRREGMYGNTSKKGTVRKDAEIPVDLAGRLVNNRNIRLEERT